MPIRHWLLIALLSAAALPADAQWRWRDANGRVTASDTPPPRSVPDKDILQRPNDAARRAPTTPPAGLASAAEAAPAPVAAASRPVDRELEARKRAADQAAQSKVKAEEDRVAAQRADNCVRARSYLAQMQTGQRVVRTNERGEREFLDDRARADEVRRANDVIAAECR